MREPGCSVAPICGGCPLISLSATDARQQRETRLRNALLQQLGTQASTLELKWTSLPQAEGYRRRVRLRVFDAGRIGFFNPHKDPECAVLTPKLRHELRLRLAGAEEFRELLSLIWHVELREADLDGKASVYLVKHNPELTLPTVALRQANLWLQGLHWAIEGEPAIVPCQRLALLDLWHYVPIGSFLQVNQAINDCLLSDLVSGAKQRGLASFCDLYAGSGNFTLPLLKAGLSGLSVELDPLAGEALRRSALGQTLPHSSVHTSAAESYARHAVSSQRDFDLVIVDPPRAGIRQDLLSMASIARRYLVYCSCNPDTLARDLKALCLADFSIESIALYDMFRHTAHVESMVWLKAPERPRR